MTDSAPQITDLRSFLYRGGALDPDGARSITAEALKGCEDGELYLQYMATEAFGFDDGRLRPPTIRPMPASACAASRAR